MLPVFVPCQPTDQRRLWRARGRSALSVQTCSCKGVVWSNLSYVDLGLRSQEMPPFLQSRSLIAASMLVEGPLTGLSFMSHTDV